MQRVVITLSGRVQGVGLRYAVKEYARSQRICGFVRNDPRGRVTVVAEGEVRQIESLLRWVRSPSRPGEVERLTVREEKATGRFAGFSIQ